MYIHVEVILKTDIRAGQQRESLAMCTTQQRPFSTDQVLISKEKRGKRDDFRVSHHAKPVLAGAKRVRWLVVQELGVGSHGSWSRGLG